MSRNQILVQLCRHLGVGKPLVATHTVEHIGDILEAHDKLIYLFKYKLKEEKKKTNQ